MTTGNTQGHYSIGGGSISTTLGEHTLYHASDYAGLRIEQPYDGYARFNFYSATGSIPVIIFIQDASNTNTYQLMDTISATANEWHRAEIIETGETSVTLYVDGVSTISDTRRSQNAQDHMWIGINSGSAIHLDDFSNTSFSIGAAGFISSSSGTIYNTITVPTADTYHMTLSKQATGKIVHTWDLTSICQTVSYTVGTYFDDDGFYYLDIYDEAGKLYYSKLLYYNILGVYPTTYFTIQSDTAADIRDHSNNGGDITGGGTVYLTPSDTQNHYQDFSIEFQEPAYNRELILTKVFNTSQVTGSIISLTGLNPNVYNVSLDSAYVGTTSGLNSFSHTVDWIGDNSYTLELSPDFSSPGSWGYVVDSSTQEKIPYARLYLSNDTYSQTAYSDENGMYYIAGLQPGAYTIQASKKGYISSPAQPFTAYAGATTRQDLYLEPSGIVSGSGLYYAPHDVAFTILEYWYSGTGLTGVSYAIYNGTTEVKTGSTDSKGMFTGADMQAGTNYTITLTHNGTTYTEYVEPALSEYTFTLNKEGILHEYYNSWLNLSYTENNGSISIAYVSNKTVSSAAVTVTAANGTDIISDSKSDQSGSFNFNLSSGDYTIKFNIEAVDGSTASQFWTLSSPPDVNLFPASYPTWLKNILYVGIIMVFLLAFGKSKNDVACGSAAVLVSLGYYFKWLSCGFNFVVLVWIIALGAIYLHYKRTGALG